MDNLEYLCIGDEVALLVVAEDPAFPNVGYVSVQVTPFSPPSIRPYGFHIVIWRSPDALVLMRAKDGIGNGVRGLSNGECVHRPCSVAPTTGQIYYHARDAF